MKYLNGPKQSSMLLQVICCDTEYTSLMAEWDFHLKARLFVDILKLPKVWASYTVELA